MDGEDRMTIAEEKVKKDYVDAWYKPQTDMNFSLSDVDGEAGPEYGSSDRDGKPLRNGQVKHFTDYDGRTRKGKIYHHINNMWWVIAGKKEVCNIACSVIFDSSLREAILRGIPKIKISITRGR